MKQIIKWSEQEVERLKAEWKTDKPTRVIAEIFGRSSNAVSLKAHYLCLPKKDYPKKTSCRKVIYFGYASTIHTCVMKSVP